MPKPGRPVQTTPIADEALRAFGRPPGELPPAPVLHAGPGTLLTYAVPLGDGRFQIAGAWVRPDGVRFLAEAPIAARGPSAAHGLTGSSADLFDRWIDGLRAFHGAVESIDAEIATTEADGRSMPPDEIFRLSRAAAGLRAQVARAVITASEASGPLAASFPGLAVALPSLTAELERVEGLVGALQQSLSDLILLRTALESNRIAEAANGLATTSNRIAELANTSNIRMLGLTYIALVLGLVSAAVLIPNTAATILGMPSAAWVPGLWVDAVLVALAVVPIVLIFRQGWVRQLLHHLRDSERRASEGIRDLPEQADRPARGAGPPP